MTSLKLCSGGGGGGGGGGDSGLCVAEHNAIRAEHGLPPFEYNEAIARASQIHIERVVRDRCEKVGNPHQCPGEKGFSERFLEQGYRAGSAVENIAAGQSSCKIAVDGWMTSEGHSKNIIHRRKHIGCGRKDNWWCCGYADPL